MRGPAARSLRAGRARLFALQGVTPSLNVYCKHTRIKQYLKENRALRTETTINNTYDFGIGRKPRNLLKLLEVGFAVNRGKSSVTTYMRAAESTFFLSRTPQTLPIARCTGLPGASLLCWHEEPLA